MTLIVNRQFSRGLSCLPIGFGQRRCATAAACWITTTADLQVHRLQRPTQCSKNRLRNTNCQLGKGKAFGGTMPGESETRCSGTGCVSYIGTYSSGTPQGFTGAVGITGWNGGTNRLNCRPGDRAWHFRKIGRIDYANRNSVGANMFFDKSLVTAPAAGNLRYRGDPLTPSSAASPVIMRIWDYRRTSDSRRSIADKSAPNS